MLKTIDRILTALFPSYEKKKFMSCGSNVYLGKNNVFYYDHISIGSNVIFGTDSEFMAARANIIIGNDVMFGPHVYIATGNHRTDIPGRPMISITNEEKLPENDQDVVLEGDNWIGMCSVILKGVTIGKGAVVGAGSVVTRDVRPYSIVAGNPAKLLHMRFSEEEVQKAMARDAAEGRESQ